MFVMNIFLISAFLILDYLTAVGQEIIAAYDKMLRTVEDFISDANYFTVEFKSKFISYDIKPDTSEKNAKGSWKQFFAETYAD